MNSAVGSTQLRVNDTILTGSNEVQALVKALQYAFPNSVHLFCMLHCKDNVRHYLTKVGILLQNREHILGLLFGPTGVGSAADEKEFENSRAVERLIILIALIARLIILIAR